MYNNQSQGMRVRNLKGFVRQFRRLGRVPKADVRAVRIMGKGRQKYFRLALRARAAVDPSESGYLAYRADSLTSCFGCGGTQNSKSEGEARQDDQSWRV